MNLCIAKPNKNCLIETFINNHVTYLHPSEIVCNGYFPGEFETRKGSIYPFLLSNKYVRGILKRISPTIFRHLYSTAFANFLKTKKISVVFAEYGLVGANITNACKIAGVPLVVIFHGFDASDHDTLKKYAKRYQVLFRYAKFIIAVSNPIKSKLISLGAPEQNIRWNPYGVDIRKFYPSQHTQQKNTVKLIFIGRLTPKKAPDLLIRAFHLAQEECQNITLSIIGSGEMKKECKALVSQLNLQNKIHFSEEVTPNMVPELLRNADIYVQHSIVSASGDSEGTPNSILEASASGLPVISTIHGGIPDAVLHGKTGFLVPEKDIIGMAHYIKLLVRDPDLRRQLGMSGRQNIEENFVIEKSIAVIQSLLQDAISKNSQL